MSQSVWHRAEIGNAAQAALNMAIAASDGASSDFVRGVYVGLVVLCQQVGAPQPRLPERNVVIVETL